MTERSSSCLMMSRVFRSDWVTSDEADIKASSVLEDLDLAVAPASSSALVDWSMVLESARLASKETVRKEDLRLYWKQKQCQKHKCGREVARIVREMRTGQHPFDGPLRSWVHLFWWILLRTRRQAPQVPMCSFFKRDNKRRATEISRGTSRNRKWDIRRDCYRYDVVLALSDWWSSWRSPEW